MSQSTIVWALLSGLLTGLSLIVAVGAQNTFVLQQGLRRSHVAVVVAICVVSDVILIAAGVLGAGAVIDAVPGLLVLTRTAGAAVLLGYAGLAGRRAVRGGRLDTVRNGPRPVAAGVVTCLALTWLNPHVYLDTVVLTGALAAAQGRQRWWFAGGSMIASAVWFVALGVGARALSRVLRTRTAWRLLDLVIAAVMVGTAARLVFVS